MHRKPGKLSIEPTLYLLFCMNHFLRNPELERAFFRLLVWMSPRRNPHDGPDESEGGLRLESDTHRLLDVTPEEFAALWKDLHVFFALDEATRMYFPINQRFLLYAKVIDPDTGRVWLKKG